MSSKRVCVMLTARPSWAKLSSICAALSRTDGIDLQIVCCASALLEKYGNVSATVEREYPIAEKVYSVYEGTTLETTAMEVGVLQEALARTYARLKPDVVLVCADRREILAAAGAARMQSIEILHIQGGEQSGSVDNDIRDAVTQLATYHCVCTKRAAMRVYALTGEMSRIWNVGCSSIDVAKEAKTSPLVDCDELGGIGPYVDLTDRFVTVLHHPVTSEAAGFRAELECLAQALQMIGLPVVFFWPGQDAGSEAGAKYLRELHEANRSRPWHFVRNLPPARFLKLLTQAQVLIGNSSAGIRECSYLGVPVVNIGSRQMGRERAKNVRDVPCEAARIIDAVIAQLAKGSYPSSTLYGRGDAGQRIAEVIRGI